MPIARVLKWNASPNVFAWKFPSEELSTLSQLIVSETQEAVLVDQGKFYGPFTAGRHTLNTLNYPILTSLVKKVLDGNTPFSAEVWFVQKAYSLEIKWGTSLPILVDDPKYHILLPVRAYGQYSIQICDTIKFLSKLVGTMPTYTEKTLQEYFKGIILKHTKDLLGKYFVERNVSIIQIVAYTKDISDALFKEITKETEEYGVKIINFTVNSISTDEKDPAVAKLRRVLVEKAEMDILGFNYHQKRTFDTLESAANNQGTSGEIMNAGLGMALGVGMGTPMGHLVGQMAQNLSASHRSSKFCSNCGNPIIETANFCPNCGMKISK